MKRKNLLITVTTVIFVLQFSDIAGQGYNMFSGPGPFNVCGGMFYDSPGDPSPPTNYGPAFQNGYITFCAAIPGQYVALTFNSIAFADVNDILRIYSGSGLGGPLLATLTQGSALPSSPFISMDLTNGCLTAQFQCNNIGFAAGWVATLSCSPVTGTNEIIVCNLLDSYIAPDQAGNNFLNLNISIPSSFTATIFSADGKKVFSRNYSLADGEYKIFLPTENLQRGIYFCRVTGENLNRSFKFVKQ